MIIRGYAGINAMMMPHGGGYVPGLDLDADAYITAESVTNAAQQLKIYNFIVALKTAGIWSGYFAFIYFFKLDAACPHKYNMLNPVSTGAPVMTWYNSPTLGTTGVSFNGTTQYGLTGFISFNTGTTDGMIGVASSGGSSSTYRTLIESLTTHPIARGIASYRSLSVVLNNSNIGGEVMSIMGNNTTSYNYKASSSSSSGFILLNRHSSSSSFDMYQNGTFLSSVSETGLVHDISGVQTKIGSSSMVSGGLSAYNGTIYFACQGLDDVSLTSTQVTDFNNAVANLLS